MAKKTKKTSKKTADPNEMSADLRLRLTEADLATFKRAAKARNLSVSAYVRIAGLMLAKSGDKTLPVLSDAPAVASVDTTADAIAQALARQLGPIAATLERIAKSQGLPRPRDRWQTAPRETKAPASKHFANEGDAEPKKVEDPSAEIRAAIAARAAAKQLTIDEVQTAKAISAPPAIDATEPPEKKTAIAEKDDVCAVWDRKNTLVGGCDKPIPKGSKFAWPRLKGSTGKVHVDCWATSDQIKKSEKPKGAGDAW